MITPRSQGEANSRICVPVVVVLSGPIAAGKTALARQLEHRGALHISTSTLMSARATTNDRADLQRLGASAEFQSGEWIVKAVAGTADDQQITVVDCIRAPEQVSALRSAGAGRWRTVHVHLTADDHVLAARYADRDRTVDEDVSWHRAMQALTEQSADLLVGDADVVLDTTRLTVEDVTVRVHRRLGSVPTMCEAHVDVLVGGQWGSEGKGNLAFHLAPEYGLLVRVGAPNAGHKVRGVDGTVYTHRQLPSGTRACDAALLLGPGAVIDPGVLLREIEECEVTPDRLTIDPRALVIEDSDVGRESGLRGAIGSTGTGGGAAIVRRIMSRGTPGAVRTAGDLPMFAPYVREAATVIDEAAARNVRVLLEGTQGTDLSLLHGTYPYVTSRDTTVGTLLSETGLSPWCLRHVIVAVRTYPIRVGGTSGPMGQEVTWDTVARRAGLESVLLSQTETGSVSGNQRRVAEFSWTQLERSARLNGATDIALTFADYLDARNRKARRYADLTADTRTFIEEVEMIAGARVSLVSVNFDGRGVIDRRLW